MTKPTRLYLGIVAVIMAAVIPAGMVALAGATSASTSACGTACTSPSVESLGTGQVLTVSGTTVVMAAASSSNSGQDWTPQQVGTVGGAVSAGVVSGLLNMLYSGATLVEFQYAPAGVPSDQCLASDASGNPPVLSVVVKQCGVSSDTLWILDGTNASNGYVDLISAAKGLAHAYPAGLASSANLFSDPYVLTVSGGKLGLAPLSEIGGVVSTSQMWAGWSAPATPALRLKVEHTR